MVYQREINALLLARLEKEPRRFIQVVQGPRQVGKTTSVLQVLERLSVRSHYASADSPELRDWRWINENWEVARHLHAETAAPVVLVLDEIQKLPRWSDVVKQLWDEDTFHGRDVRTVVLGSSPLLLGRAMRESLAGRFEIIRATHWTWREMRDAFEWDLDTFIFYGGLPGAAPLIGDTDRWRDYVLETVVETTLARDVLHLSRVDKPAALRRLVYLAAEYSGRELSYRKMMQGVDDVSNASTVVHYLHLLAEAGIATALQKYAGEGFRRRATTPKLQVHNTGLISAMAPRTFREARSDPEWWGRLTESCVGAHLLAQPPASAHDELCYWRDRDLEVDFVLRAGAGLIAVEVKSGKGQGSTRGLTAFAQRYGEKVHPLIVGTGGMPLEQFLESRWTRLG